MTRRTLPYQEGTYFDIPLGRVEVIGVVARANRGVLLCYFFEPGTSLLRENALFIARVGDLALLEGRWRVRGNFEEWRREGWPIPPLVQADPLTSRVWVIEYDDDDPVAEASRRRLESKESFYENALFGYEALEDALAARLAKKT